MILSLRQVCRRREAGGRAFELMVDALDISPGEFVAVTGASGSGKSTLLDLLGLVLRPSQAKQFLFTPRPGTAFAIEQLWGRQESALAELRRHHLGYILQQGGLLPFLTVAQNLALVRDLIARPCPPEDIDQALDSLGLKGQAAKKPTALSGGERQRVAVLRALFNSPALVLADEPTAALDRDRARNIVAELKQRAASMQTTVIMVTHDPALLTDVADRWITLEQASPPGSSMVRYVCKPRA